MTAYPWTEVSLRHNKNQRRKDAKSQKGPSSYEQESDPFFYHEGHEDHEVLAKGPMFYVIRVLFEFPMPAPPLAPDDLLTRLQACGSLLAELPASALTQLAPAVTTHRYPAGALLFCQDERAEGFFVIEQGTVTVARLAADGRERVLHRFGPGELVGEVPVFQGGAYPATATAVDQVQALRIGRDRFVTIGSSHPDILFDLLAVLAQRLRHFVRTIDALAFSDVQARLARVLLDDQRGGVVQLQGTKAQLAARIGTVPETLSRTLRKLEAAGCLHVDRRRIQLLDAERLEEIAAGG